MNMFKIIRKYNDDGRYYHNFLHVARMFEYARQHGVKLSKVQEYAIIYHDIIYDPKLKTNEEMSVDYMIKDLKKYDDGRIDANKVAQIILDTKYEVPEINESKNVIDLDLYRLGMNAYCEDSMLIRSEYNHLSDKEFYEGRREWLNSFLARSSIYVGFLKNTPRELSARANLENELAKIVGMIL